MIKNKLRKTESTQLIFLGLALSLVYKACKFSLQNILGLDPYTDYRDYQYYLTYYRVFATLAGVFIVNRYFMSFKDQFKVSSNKFVKAFSVSLLIGFLLIRIYFYKIYIDVPKFLDELFFNFFVGTWEEYFSRGLILFGLMGLIKRKNAIIVSSIYFSIWHWETVTSGFGEFYFLFIMGIIFAAFFILSKNFLEVALLHFTWDQIFFGCQTDISSKIVAYLYEATLYTAVTIAALIIVRKLWIEESFKNIKSS